MNGENQPLVINQNSWEWEITIEAQDFRGISHHFLMNLDNIPQINKERLKDVNM